MPDSLTPAAIARTPEHAEGPCTYRTDDYVNLTHTICDLDRAAHECQNHPPAEGPWAGVCGEPMPRGHKYRQGGK